MTIKRIQVRKLGLGKEMGLHRPSGIKVALEAVGARGIEPGDIGDCQKMVKIYPALAGARGEGLGPSDFYGKCQSYQGDRGWWRGFLERHGVSPDRKRR